MKDTHQEAPQLVGHLSGIDDRGRLFRVQGDSVHPQCESTEEVHREIAVADPFQLGIKRLRLFSHKLLQCTGQLIGEPVDVLLCLVQLVTDNLWFSALLDQLR